MLLPFGAYENAYVENCNKLLEGTQCVITLKVYKSIKEYARYLPLNYNCVKLYFSDHSVLVKQSDELLALLSCPILSENISNVCAKTKYSTTINVRTTYYQMITHKQ